MLAFLCMLVACSTTDPIEPTAEPDPDTVLQPSTDTSVVDTAPPVDTGTTDTATTPSTTVWWDCANLTPGPVTFHEIPGFSTAEDFDFDHDGYLVANFDSNLVGKNRFGDSRIVATNLGSNTSGTRQMHTGNWVVADANAGTLIHVDDATGAKSTLFGGMTWPNGIDLDGDVLFVSDFTDGVVLEIDATYPEGFQVIASGLDQPNGVILSPDGQTLYVLIAWAAGIMAYDRNGYGGWDERVFHTQVGGNYQGINIDICGNVYWTDVYTQAGGSRIWRKSADGTVLEVVADLPAGYVPNMRWGQGVGGWEADILYASDREDGNVYGLELGVPGKPHVMGP